MTAQESLRRFGLVPDDASLPEVRELLAREAEAERKGTLRAEDLAYLCSIQLFSRGRLEDVLRIWDAKVSGMDLGASIDIQLLCGAGLAETKAFLAGRGTREAAGALGYIEECEAAGDFEDFSVASRMAQYRDYFAIPT